MKSHLLGAVSACVFTFTSITTAQAAPVSGQGTWETTLEGRLETAPGSGVFLAYYDTVLDITWATNANIDELGGWLAGGKNTWNNQVAWAAGLTLGGVSGWRLPTVSPIDGSTFDTSFSNNATTDVRYAHTTTDGTDGGWRNASNTPVSEMGHMYYVTLGNLGGCTPDDANPSSCVLQPGWGLTNTGPFFDVQLAIYWSGTEFDSGNAWFFQINHGGIQDNGNKNGSGYGWAVRSGDVPAVVPVPAAVWLFGSGLIGLLSIARRKR
jgi:hypothetical protein